AALRRAVAAHRPGGAAGGARACDRGADGQGPGGAGDRARGASASAAAGSGGCAVGATGAASGYRGSGAARGGGERADRDRAGGVLSAADAGGLGWIPELELRELVRAAEPVLVGGSAARRDTVRRGAAAVGGGRAAGGVRCDGGGLPADRAHRVRAGG